ncbi:hypothetical protein ACJIZ3_004758 [Penstemon smallii]|uniref:Uncharacterized protein n=1 Tax=Penstemon smallii TaxID=265156 RepID=A0ABD3S311_9LAMI
MAIAVNLVTYLDGTMHLPSATSSNIVSTWAGISFLLSVFGAILADSFLGRYWTIIIFSNGTCLLAVSSVLPNLRPPKCNPALPGDCTEANDLQMGVFYVALYTMAVGMGGIKCSVSGFGTDQFDQKDEKEKTQMGYFFNRFYFFISIGTLLAVTVFIYIQDKVARVWGYGSCTALMFFSVVVFLSGTKRYRYKGCPGSPVLQVMQVVVAAIRKRKIQLPSKNEQLYENQTDESRIMRTRDFRCLDKAAILENVDNAMTEAEIPKPNPWRLCSVTKVEEVKMMVRILPIFATTIMFWTVHAQMITFSVQQAATMNRSIGSFQVPAGSLNAFFIGAILLTLGIYDRVIIPLWKKKKGTQGLTSLQKMGLGLLISIFSMGVAAIMEARRLKVAKSTSSMVFPLPVSAFILVPQFVLAGAAEGFVYTGQLDFFLTESPKGMKAISTSLFLTTISFGFFVSSVLVTIVRKLSGSRHNWLPPNLNNGRLDLFYGVIALICAINLGLYILCAKWFKKKKAQTLN